MAEKGPCIFIGGKTLVVTYQQDDFFSNDSHNLVLYVKDDALKNKFCQLALVSCIHRSLKYKYTWGDSISYRKIQEDVVNLPVRDGKIDVDFMISFIAELEVQQITELEAYLLAAGLNNTQLSSAEEQAISDIDSIVWKTFNLKELYGESTRGKRLKSADRIPGKLPFVTAGEADEGISDFIGNNVQVFRSNTITIDMFGSAKYRSYDYGADGHIAVVHTEKLTKNEAVFVTAAIHKSAHNGQFHYGHNFYAKDADDLMISLPAAPEGNPDYSKMEIIISAIHKLVIQGVNDYSERKIEATKNAVA